MSVAEGCLAFSGLFEAEVLVELMLRFWAHPHAADDEFRNNLLEGAADALRSCVAGEKILEEVPASETNFIAAMWYVEWSALASGSDDPQGQRQAWLEKIRKSLPSCFCPLDDL